MELLIAAKWPLIIFQLILSPFLIILVLLQAGKGDDIGSALGGGGGGNAVAGSGGVSKVIVRLTIVAAVLFMLNSIALAKIYKELDVVSYGTSETEPLAPAPGALPSGVQGGAEVPAEGVKDGQKEAPQTETQKGPETAPAEKK